MIGKRIFRVLLIILILVKCGVVFCQSPVFTYSPSTQNYTTGTPITPLAPTNTSGSVPAVIYGKTVTFAGNGQVGTNDGVGTAAGLSGPVGIAFDVAGNLYITNYHLAGIPYLNDFIRKITPAGVVTTLAGNVSQGSANGQGNAAHFFSPNGVAVDLNGNVYVADVGNNVIRKITPAGLVSTFAGTGQAGSMDGAPDVATFSAPSGIAIDGSNNLYVADYSNNLIRMITPGGVVTTLAGGGAGSFTNANGTFASFKNPQGVAVDKSGNVYVADAGNNVIRKIAPGGDVTTFAGDGSFGLRDGAVAQAQFFRPTGVAVDIGGNVYVADAANNLIRKISKADGQVSTLAGNGQLGYIDDIGRAASFNDPEGIAVDAAGNVYVGDKGNNVVRKISGSGYTISPNLPAGLNFDGTSGIITGTPLSPSPATLYTVTAYNAFGSSTATITITCTGNTIVKIAPPVISYATPQVYKVNLTIAPLAPSNTGGAVPQAVYGGTTIFAGSGIPGFTDNTGSQAAFNAPDGTAVDASGNIYVADGANNSIRKITPAGVVTTLAGNGQTGSSNGTGASASFNQPEGVAVDAAGNVYVADAGNNLIRKITPGGAVTTFASGIGNPSGIAVDANGNVYVADFVNNLIKIITPGGTVRIFAGSGVSGADDGTGSAASFNHPAGIAIDVAGYLYVTDEGDNLIRKITPGALVSTIAGSGSPGSADGIGDAASFNAPVGIAVDEIGNLYIGDSGNQTIRKVTPNGTVTTLAGKAGVQGRASGQGPAASFNTPRGIAIDANGNLYVGDLINNLIRQVSARGYAINLPLPAGLIFDNKTGIISGTPAVATPAQDYVITAYNNGGESSFTVNIDVETPVVIVVDPPSISYVSPQNYIINNTIIPLQPANTGGAVPATIYGQVNAFAGSGSPGSADGVGASAAFSAFHAVATDLVGNIYLTDNNRIRKITPSGAVSTLAGSGAAGSADGQGAAASFNQPLGITVNGNGVVYVADTKNNVIRRITPAGVVTTLAGSLGVTGQNNGQGSAASFNTPQGLGIDANGNIYVADAGNNLIRQISPSGFVKTFAGTGVQGSTDGPSVAASFNNPVSIAVDLNNNVYAADAGDNVIRLITPSAVVSTLAGSGVAGSADGQYRAASFNNPSGITADVAGNIYVADAANNLIRKIDKSGVVTTLAGDGSAGAVNGTFTSASFNHPVGISADIFGNIYVADFNNYTVREIVTTGYTISAPLPTGLTFDIKTGIITGTPTALSPKTTYTVTAYNTGGSSSTQIVITVSNKAVPPVPPPNITYTPNILSYTVNTPIAPLAPVNTGGILPDKIFGQTTTFAGTGSPGSNNAIGTDASFNQPFGVATDVNGNVYIVDHLNNLIRKITPAGLVSTFAGSGTAGSADGVGTAASFNNPTGIAVDVAGNVYVADVSNNLIRKITPAGVVTTLAGKVGSFGSQNGQGTAATFNNPSGVAVDAAGNVYVTDLSNNLIRKITPGGLVSTLAGTGLTGATDATGTDASFNQPYGVAVDSRGYIFVADWGNNLIREITPTGVVTTLAGSGKAGSADGQGAAASFYKPFGLTIDESGNVYVADTNNELIREVTPGGLVTTVAGDGAKGAVNGINTQASFYQPTGIVADGAGNVYIADEFNHLIRRVVVVSNFTIDKTLPAGLTFDHTTGVISGTATEVAPQTNYTITAYNAGGSSSFVIGFAVNKLHEAITFGPIAAKTYGDPDFNIRATSNNNTIPITYTSSNLLVATVTDNIVHIIGAGTTTITASQTGSDSYLPADPALQTLTVNPAVLTITADDKNKDFEMINPVFTVKYNGFVNGESAVQLTSPPIVTTTAVTNSPVGTYPITASGAQSANYTFVYVPGTLTVHPIPQTLVIPNTFTPNGDGINDLWNINALVDYPRCTVNIYSRYGILVFRSVGYAKAFDGTYNGKPLPMGTYYYIINPDIGRPALSGPLTILR